MPPQYKNKLTENTETLKLSISLAASFLYKNFARALAGGAVPARHSVRPFIYFCFFAPFLAPALPGSDCLLPCLVLWSSSVPGLS